MPGQERIGQRVVASWSAKTGVAWLFSRFDTPKEGFEGQVNPHRHILQDLRMHASQRGTLLLHGGEDRRLLVIGQQLLWLYNPPAFLKVAGKNDGLFFRRPQAIFHAFEHGDSLA